MLFFPRPLQDPIRGRPKEIPHNEKLLSLKYEVKLLLTNQNPVFPDKSWIRWITLGYFDVLSLYAQEVRMSFFAILQGYRQVLANKGRN